MIWTPQLFVPQMFAGIWHQAGCCCPTIPTVEGCTDICLPDTTPANLSVTFEGVTWCAAALTFLQDQCDWWGLLLGCDFCAEYGDISALLDTYINQTHLVPFHSDCSWIKDIMHEFHLCEEAIPLYVQQTITVEYTVDGYEITGYVDFDVPEMFRLAANFDSRAFFAASNWSSGERPWDCRYVTIENEPNDQVCGEGGNPIGENGTATVVPVAA